MPNSPDSPGTNASFVARLGGGVTALAKICVMTGMVSIILVIAAGSMPEAAKTATVWFQRGIVLAAALTLFYIFIRHPLASRRPEGLTEPLLWSLGLFLAAWVTGVWVGVFITPVAPILVVGSLIVERIRRA